MPVRKYLYGVIKHSSPVTFAHPGVGEGEGGIYTVHFRDLAMVVSDVESAHIDPTRKNALCHEEVLGLIMQQFTVIPCAFGTLVPNSQKIILFLESNYHELHSTFLKIDHKIELGLKIFWKKEFFHYLRRENPEIQSLTEEIARGGDDPACYQKKIWLGELVEKLVEEKRGHYGAVIFEKLSGLAEEAKLNRTFGINMIFNAAFLVDKDREALFDQEVEDLYRQFEEILNFSYTGPWPAHNFVHLDPGGDG